LIGILTYYFVIFRQEEIKQSILRSQYIEIDISNYKQKLEVKEKESIEKDKNQGTPETKESDIIDKIEEDSTDERKDNDVKKENKNE
jgi:hypothetical protein